MQVYKTNYCINLRAMKKYVHNMYAKYLFCFMHNYITIKNLSSD